MQLFLALWAIKILPPDHDAKKPTSPGPSVSETHSFMAPYQLFFLKTEKKTIL